jgi:hypothetical protein
VNDEPIFDAEVPPPEGADELSPANVFPWPPRDDESPIDALAKTWTGSMLHPAAFFRSMPEDAPIGPAILYALILGIAGAAIRMFWGLILPASGALEDMDPATLAEHPMQLFLASAHPTLSSFLLSPVIMLLAILFSAAVIQVVLAMLVKQRGPFSRTLRMLCYAQSTALFAIVPFLGAVIAFFWSFVITIIGVREVHRTTTGRATATMLMPCGCMFVLFVILGILAAIFIGSGMLPKLPA